MQNEICAGLCSVLFWKDGAAWSCNMSDVATWLDRVRDAAIPADKRLQEDFEPIFSRAALMECRRLSKKKARCMRASLCSILKVGSQ